MAAAGRRKGIAVAQSYCRPTEAYPTVRNGRRPPGRHFGQARRSRRCRGNLRLGGAGLARYARGPFRAVFRRGWTFCHPSCRR